MNGLRMSMCVIGVLCIVAISWLCLDSVHEPVQFDLPRLTEVLPIQIAQLPSLPSCQSWSFPVSQSADGLWLWDLMTPPCIEINPLTQRFRAKPLYPISCALSDLECIALETPTYPWMLEGYIELREDAYVLIMYHLPTHTSVRLQCPGFDPHYNLTALGFTPPCYDANTQDVCKAQLLLKDHQYNVELCLRPQEPVLLNSFRLVLQSTNSPQQQYVLSQLGDSITLGSKTYTVCAVDVVEGTVILECSSSQFEHPQFISLSL